ncbi:LysR family transcriptional regulator [Paraburkholderia sp. MMS20-SJTR3]|uniref:LysR family transcriptional regulator n=1 Tax=Paraburkholderia sejongensis TaxID=2886946 RepID=A0ABS8JVA2_9BURK|nr:LysR family transcriptional regulator [Paraburkholderia sp. MMS20-SJTR3]MCC8393675.1 LysR family transcriptional regulator [Paraburkholderia sp. MMS20-SJTR3]
MREISLDRLRTLVVIADLGSFAEAARVLHLAPPTVSLHIAELESRVGAPLLSRKRGQVRPSAIGETLIGHARQLLSDAEHAFDDVRRQAEGLGGRVRLGASTSAIANLLPQALGRLANEHPGIDVQIAVLTSAQTLARLADESLDVGIVALPQPPVKGLSIERWRRDPVVALMPAQWRCPARITPQWLAAKPLILNDAGTRLSRLTTEWFSAAGQHPSPRIQLNYADAIRSLVAAGYGAALLPQESGRALPADERIVTRPLRPALWRQLGLAYRAGSGEAATAHVLDVLRSLREG